MKDECPICGKELKGWGEMIRPPFPSAASGPNPKTYRCPNCGNAICDKAPVTA